MYRFIFIIYTSFINNILTLSFIFILILHFFPHRLITSSNIFNNSICKLILSNYFITVIYFLSTIQFITFIYNILSIINLLFRLYRSLNYNPINQFKCAFSHQNYCSDYFVCSTIFLKPLIKIYIHLNVRIQLLLFNYSFLLSYHLLTYKFILFNLHIIAQSIFLFYNPLFKIKTPYYINKLISQYSLFIILFSIYNNFI